MRQCDVFRSSAVAGLVPATTANATTANATTHATDFDYFCGGWPVQDRPLHWAIFTVLCIALPSN